MLELGGQKALSPDNNLMVGVTLPLDLNGRKEGRVGVAEREVELKQRPGRRARAPAARRRAHEGRRVLAARRNLG